MPALVSLPVVATSRVVPADAVAVVDWIPATVSGTQISAAARRPERLVVNMVPLKRWSNGIPGNLPFRRCPGKPSPTDKS